MADLLFNRLTAIWALLIGATLVSVESVHGLFGDRGQAAAVAVIIVAFIKIRFVGIDFMELRHAPKSARYAFEAWVVVLCSSIITVHCFGIRA